MMGIWRTSWWLPAAASAIALSVVGCGGDESNAAVPNGTTPAPNGAAMNTPAATPTAGTPGGATAPTGTVPMAGTPTGPVAGPGGPGGPAGPANPTTPVAIPDGAANLACVAPLTEPTGTCAESSEGIYALKTELDVWWEADAEYVTNPGRGKITVFLMGYLDNVCQSADGMGAGSGVIRSCGSRLPPLSAEATCRAFPIAIPDSAWDSDQMPTFTTTGSVSGFEPGSFLALAPQTGLVGVDLASLDAPWPTPAETASFACGAGTGEACFPDHDGDGNPGLTATSMGEGPVGSILPAASMDCPGAFGAGYSLSALPLSVLGGALPTPDQLASEVHLGLRIRIGGGGVINDDCMSGAGDAIAEALETRVYGCKRVDGMPCDATQAEFVDAKTPVYKILQKGDVPSWPAAYATDARIPKWTTADLAPSEGPKGEVVRLADLGTELGCDAVRAAFGE